MMMVHGKKWEFIYLGAIPHSHKLINVTMDGDRVKANKSRVDVATKANSRGIRRSTYRT